MKKGFTILAVLFLLVAFAPPSSPKKDWSVSLQLWTFRLFNFTDAIKKADSCGIKIIQAYPTQDLGGGMTGKFGPQMTSAEKSKVKQMLKSKGMTFNAFGVTGADTEAEWQKLFLFAKEMNIPIIVCEPKDEQWGYINKLAGIYKIKVAIHDHPKPNHYWTPDSVLAAIKNHPNLGACADVGHWARNGLNIVECLKKLQGHIYNVHLKDIVKFDDPKAADAIPGKGVIDFPAVFAELKRQGYKGSFAIEHESNWENNAGEVIEIVKFYHDQVNHLK